MFVEFWSKGEVHDITFRALMLDNLGSSFDVLFAFDTSVLGELLVTTGKSEALCFLLLLSFTVSSSSELDSESDVSEFEVESEEEAPLSVV